MEIIVVNVCKEVRKYIDRVKKGDSPEICWEEVISKYWEQLCIYSPFDLSERKPKPIMDIDNLNMQCEFLEKIDIGYFVVQKYLNIVNKDVVDILEVKPEEILKKTFL